MAMDPIGPTAAVHRPRKRTPPGSPPGTLVADPAAIAPTIRVMAFGAGELDERTAVDPDDLNDLIGRRTVTWIDVAGLADLATIRRLGDRFGLHGLALEDVVNVHQRPKFEDYEDHLYIVTRMPEGGTRGRFDQLSLFLWHDVVLTFQERPGDCFEPVRKRLRDSHGRMRERGADYLAYALLDAVTDSYFPLAERLGDEVEALEDAVVAEPDPHLMARIQSLRHDLMALRRIIWSQREMLNGLLRDPSELIADATDVYLRDCYDHAVQLLDIVETYREVAAGLVEIHLTSLSNRMNEVMKVLTVIATVFIPLTFIAGVYGMNFRPEASPWNMPELSWYWGYPASLVAMLAVGLGCVLFFWRRGWIGNRRSRPRGRRR